MDSLITSATSSFETTIGFPMTDVVDKGVEFLKLAFGTGLGFFTAVWPLLLVIGIIYLVYRIARMGWHSGM